MIAIIDYHAGNLTSVARAVSHIGCKCVVTHSHEQIEAADRIIFPGVGAAGSAMESLKRLGLDTTIKAMFLAGKPILGICLGTQIIMGHSEENNTRCLGFVDGNVRAFPSKMPSANEICLKIPHMGWNRIQILHDHPIFSGVNENDEFYFVHSFYPAPGKKEHILSVTDYGISFPSVVGFDNIIATQFHLEKSGRPGLNMLKNFCTWQPC
jgi:glutamine amidotransferase